MLDGNQTLRLLDDIDYLLPQDRKVLEVICLHGGLTNKWEVYKRQGRGGFRGVRAVGGSLQRLADRGLITIDHEQVSSVDNHKVTQRHRIEANLEAIREEANKKAVQLSLF